MIGQLTPVALTGWFSSVVIGASRSAFDAGSDAAIVLLVLPRVTLYVPVAYRVDKKSKDVKYL